MFGGAADFAGVEIDGKELYAALDCLQTSATAEELNVSGILATTFESFTMESIRGFKDP